MMTYLIQAGQHHAGRAGSPFSSHLVRWLISFGGIGLFGISALDSSVIPLPVPGSTDLILLFLASNRSVSSVLAGSFVAWAVAGSIVGGYLTWAAGTKGGKSALEKHVPQRYLSRLTGWVERHGMLSIFVAALLPPPIPLLPFLLAAGAFGIARGRFLLAYSASRTLRYGFIGWLGFTYGRRFARSFQRHLAGWSTPLLYIYISIVALGAIYALWKFNKQRRATKLTASASAKSPQDPLGEAKEQSLAENQ
jgi:membrane protein DedA with SNARE-associated domain